MAIKADASAGNATSIRRRKAAKEDKGLFRSLLAGSGRSLREAFANLADSDYVDQVMEHPTRPILGARISLSESEGKGHWNFFTFGQDLFLVLADFTYIDPRLERLPGDGLLEFHIKLSGHLKLSTRDAEPIYVEGPSLLVWEQPDGCAADEEVASDTPEKSVSLYCRPEFIIESLLGGADFVPPQLQKFVCDSAEAINFCQLPLSPDLLRTALNLFGADERLPETLWLVYAESKAFELMCLIVAAFEQLSNSAVETFSDADLERFRKAQQILSEQFDPPPTIMQLAKMLGTNETKLKNGFKSLYGMTIFEFRHRRRMQLSLNLLETSQLPVGIVAERVGYQHQTTFTTAFKTFYGFCPKDVRKLHKSA